MTKMPSKKLGKCDPYFLNFEGLFFPRMTLLLASKKLGRSVAQRQHIVKGEHIHDLQTVCNVDIRQVVAVGLL